MIKYILKRLLAACVSIFALITLTFFLMHSVPGSPFSAEAQKNVPPRVLENLRVKYGLDQPVWRQYLNYLKNLSRGDMGTSFRKLNYTVNELIAAGYPVSLDIGFWAIAIAAAAGIPLGIAAAMKKGGWVDWFSLIFATIGVSLPPFIVAMLLLYIFSIKLQILPVFGYGTVKQMIIPVACLAFLPIAYITRLMRSSMLEVLRQDYMRCARARGVPEFYVITKHGLRNSILPVVTYIGPVVSVLLTGNFVIEHLFMIPGIGRYFVTAVSERDYSVILGITIFYGAFLLVCTLVVDIVYAIIDPRVKFTK